SRQQQGQQRTARLAIMDQDGANHRFLTDGKNLVMSPRFSPDLKHIAFLDYAHNKPRVYLFNRETKRTTLVGNFSGMTFAPRFSPDGERLAMSFSHEGNTSLFEMNLKTLKIKRLTFDPVIDTSP
ncbi:MAG: Tol-Pal system protein TolB, partial [Alphaproteobacteria bacterium]|nr:Tol-Pal system protein TolB [Alphaproteobacteria bacterium]